MDETITRAELLKASGAPDATHAVFYGDGMLYMCCRLNNPDEQHERTFWRDRGMVFKRVVE